jgi:hypothetical protein
MLAGLPEATRLWPYPGYSGTSRIFLASILAAIAAPILWIAWSGDLAGLRGGAINILIVSLGLAGQTLLHPVGQFAVANLAVAVGMVWVLYAARWEQFRDTRPTPLAVRGAFFIFTLVLLAVGAGLMFRIPLFPWRLEPDISIAYGVIFLGAAAYFAYGLIWPVWSNAIGQLIGFLAYDVVLIVPYLRLWPLANGGERISLIVYLLVLVASGALAVGYLFVNRTWRLLK